jgi:hypothetical protein
MKRSLIAALALTALAPGVSNALDIRFGPMLRVAGHGGAGILRIYCDLSSGGLSSNSSVILTTATKQRTPHGRRYVALQIVSMNPFGGDPAALCEDKAAFGVRWLGYSGDDSDYFTELLPPGPGHYLTRWDPDYSALPGMTGEQGTRRQLAWGRIVRRQMRSANRIRVVVTTRDHGKWRQFARIVPWGYATLCDSGWKDIQYGGGGKLGKYSDYGLIFSPSEKSQAVYSTQEDFNGSCGYTFRSTFYDPLTAPVESDGSPAGPGELTWQWVLDGKPVASTETFPYYDDLSFAFAPLVALSPRMRHTITLTATSSHGWWAKQTTVVFAAKHAHPAVPDVLAGITP